MIQFCIVEAVHLRQDALAAVARIEFEGEQRHQSKLEQAKAEAAALLAERMGR